MLGVKVRERLRWMLMVGKFTKTRMLLKEMEGMKFDYDKSINKQVDVIKALLDEAGNSGMSAQFVGMQVVRETHSVTGPFALLIPENYGLYPQYPIERRLNEFYTDIAPWLRQQARKNLKEHNNAAYEVKRHWRMIADGFLPEVTVKWVKK